MKQLTLDINCRFHPENVEPLSPISPRIEIRISQLVDREELPHLNVVIKSFSHKVLVKGQMNNGLISIEITSDVAQLSGASFMNRFYLLHLKISQF